WTTWWLGCWSACRCPEATADASDSRDRGRDGGRSGRTGRAAPPRLAHAGQFRTHARAAGRCAYLAPARARHGLRGVARIPARRRRARDRLAAHRAQRAAAHQVVPRGTRAQPAVAGRHARLDAVRHALALQVRAGRTRGGAGGVERGARGVLTVLGAMVRWDARAGGQSEPLSEALSRARRLALPGCRVLLLSDGACTDADARAALSRLARRAETRVLIVADALELQAPPPGSYAFETAAGRAQVNLAAAAARLRFRDALSAGQRALIEACDASGVRWRRISGGDDPLSAVSALLDPRATQR